MYQEPKTEIEVLYRNFDGLDVAFQGRIPDELIAHLQEAKEKAQEQKQAALITYRGHKMHVAEGGSKGGYAYRCDTGPDGAIWFFKKPNGKDPWGIRVSVKALSHALYGLGGTRARIYEFLEGIGAALAHQGESISRVDYAVDLIMPDFVLFPQNMVMHSSMNRMDIEDPEIKQSNGTSGRFTSVTAGSMPGRQVIIYDKRAEVIKKKKSYWWEIWNAWRRDAGLPELDRQDKEGSRIWRLEVRAGKDCLKKKWGITTWEDLDKILGNVFLNMLDDVRYALPPMINSGDTNRSRWPNQPLWNVVRSVVKDDLFEMICPVDEKIIKGILRKEKEAELTRQFIGLAATIGAVGDYYDSQVEHLPEMLDEVLRFEIERNGPEFIKKMQRARERYTFLAWGPRDEQ